MQFLDIISVNIWNILISLLNLLILFLILKKFLFKPVRKALADRQEQVDSMYGEADKSRTEANAMKRQYEEKMAAARDEADGLVRTATRNAQQRSDAMLAETTGHLSYMKQKAEEDIAQEKKQMLRDVQGEISQMAVEIASKIVGREINAEDHKQLVDDFIRNVGDGQ